MNNTDESENKGGSSIILHHSDPILTSATRSNTKAGCVFQVAVPIQYRLYCSMRNSDEITTGKTQPTLLLE